MNRFRHRPGRGHHRIRGGACGASEKHAGPIRRHHHPAGSPWSSRLLQISDDMEELIRTFHPDEMAVEELFFTKNITTGIAVAHGRGVILLSAERLGVPVFEYTPMQVKQAVAGYGGADKRQVS